MGLDAYFYSEANTLTDDQKKFYSPIEIQYFRRFQTLQDWMHRLHLKKGGSVDPVHGYNGINTYLTLDDLDALDAALDDLSDDLDEWWPMHAMSLKKTIIHLRVHISRGMNVWYTSSW
jgi:hypothetical protein